VKKAAIFLDRDGTIIEDRNYLSDPDLAVLNRGAAEGLRRMITMGFALVVITNQSGVARGYFSRDAVDRVNRRIADLLAEEGIEILGWYVCPHGPEDGCRCRKPMPGLIESAVVEHDLDLTASFVVGDKPADVELACAVNARGILVTTGHGSEYATWALARGIPVCSDLVDVVQHISKMCPSSFSRES